MCGIEILHGKPFVGDGWLTLNWRYGSLGKGLPIGLGGGLSLDSLLRLSWKAPRWGPGLLTRSLPCLTKSQFPHLENGGLDEETKHKGMNQELNRCVRLSSSSPSPPLLKKEEE